MAWNQIDVTTPAGGSKKKFGDDAIRELKGQVINNLQEISHYPVSSTLRKAVWTTATRPASGLVDRVSGYNTTTGHDEYYDLASGTWISCGIQTDAIQALVDAIIPVGAIVIWSGSSASIPAKWALCNGANGTPNLMDRFVVGAGQNYPVGNTGGAAEVTLNANQVPIHNHTITSVSGSLSDNGNPGTSFIMDNNEGVYGTQSNPQAVISNAGGGLPHTNIPPYYALCYIVRTG